MLDGFIEDFRDRHGIVLDWVYEGKMMYGLVQLVASRRIRSWGQRSSRCWHKLVKGAVQCHSRPLGEVLTWVP